ncbi:MAG: hypothetical protein C5B59_02190 [Bacteroidetes bacterium]|nr:MAG: hypothetical protein C5B59_02190 [Bacteroidota bacterium]
MAFGVSAQDLSKIGKGKPFAITGNVGGGFSFYHSTETMYTQPPLAWNLYGNFNPTVYNFSFPFSFVLTQYSSSYTTPFAQFGISPTYKWIKLHLGYRTINMSPLVFGGQSFLGVGVELTPGKFRFAAFYGSLNKAISEDTTSGHLAQPQYGRIGYGFKVGYGTEANHIDLLCFHAKDDSGSIKLINQVAIIHPQENSVVGASFKLGFLHQKIIWTGDLAASALTRDLSSAKANRDTLTNGLDKLASRFITYRNSTSVSYAGQTQVFFYVKSFHTSIGYRRVQPDFNSLGVPYMLNDLQNFQWNGGLVLNRGRVNLTGSLNDQQTGISGREESKFNALTGSFNLGAMLSTHANLSVAFTTVNIGQSDGTAHLSDTVRRNEQVYNISMTPSINFGSVTAYSNLSLSLTWSMLNDQNPFTSPTDNSNTLTGMLAYSCSFTSKSISVTGSLLYNRYAQDTNTYSSAGFNVGLGGQLLKAKNLGFQLSAGYLVNHYTLAAVSNNITGSANLHYTFHKRHSLAAFFNLVTTPPTSSGVNLQQKVPYAVSTTNLAGGLSYNYSF